MTISTAATATPITKPNSVFPFIDIQTGCLTEHGSQVLNQYYNFIVGMNRITPCNATGKNIITLTPLAASPLIEKYTDHEVYVFVAEQTSDGNVTATVVPKKGALTTLRVFKTNGTAQAAAGDVIAAATYLAIYNDAMDAGNGGLILK